MEYPLFLRQTYLYYWVYEWTPDKWKKTRDVEENTLSMSINFFFLISLSFSIILFICFAVFAFFSHRFISIFLLEV